MLLDDSRVIKNASLGDERPGGSAEKQLPPNEIMDV